MGCVQTDSWLWPYLAGVATMTILLWILAAVRLTDFNGTSARHTHFSQLSNSSVNELPRDRQFVQRNSHGHKHEDGRLHYKVASSVRGPACVQFTTAGDETRGSSNFTRSRTPERASVGRCVQGASGEESRYTQPANQNPLPCTK